MSTLPKSFYRFQCNPYQNPSGISHRNRKTPNLYEPTKSHIPKGILRKNKGGGISSPDFKLHVQSLAKQLHGVAISVSIWFGQVACSDL